MENKELEKYGPIPATVEELREIFLRKVSEQADASIAYEVAIKAEKEAARFRTAAGAIVEKKSAEVNTARSEYYIAAAKK